MRKMIVLAVIGAAATITIAWSMSQMLSRPTIAKNAEIGGGGVRLLIPTELAPSW